MPRRHSPFALVIATVAASSLFSTTSSVATSSATELCFGEVPTIVGSTDEWDLYGTDEPDVIVTNGSGVVYAGDGDDLVCVTGKTVGLEGQTFLGTGTGRDRVDASKSESVFFTSLGGGSDEYIGGPARDTVLDGGRAVDLISTSGGHDRVFTHGGADVVDLGAGTDRLLLLGDPSEGAVLTGGAGSNTLGIQVLGVQGTHSWKVDNDAESLLRDGNPEVSWERFEHFDVAARGPVTFIGTDLDETLALRKHLGFAGAIPWRPRWPLDVRMRGGDDIVTFYGASVSTSISGGEGVDQLRYETPSFESSAQIAVRIDLSRGILRVTKTPGTETTQRTVNFEDVAVSNYSFGSTLIKGTDGPNRLTSHWSSGGTSPTSIYGRAGDDLLVGSYGDDLLIGGSGRDVAKGGNGLDRCEAEDRFSCELMP